MLRAAPDAPAGAADDPAELLDIDVDELARAGALVAAGRLEPEAAEAAQPNRVRIPETVESAIPSVSAISAAVMRSPRSARSPPPVRPAVRFATRLGAEERSNSSLVAGAVAADPLTRTTHTDTGGLGRRRERPPLNNNAPDEPAPPLQLSAALP